MLGNQALDPYTAILQGKPQCCQPGDRHVLWHSCSAESGAWVVPNFYPVPLIESSILVSNQQIGGGAQNIVRRPLVGSR